MGEQPGQGEENNSTLDTRSLENIDIKHASSQDPRMLWNGRIRGSWWVRSENSWLEFGAVVEWNFPVSQRSWESYPSITPTRSDLDSFIPSLIWGRVVALHFYIIHEFVPRPGSLQIVIELHFNGILITRLNRRNSRHIPMIRQNTLRIKCWK